MAVHIEKLDPKDAEIYKNCISDPKPYLEERYVITAFNEGGHNSTSVDLIDTLKHVKENMPELWESI